MLLRDTCSTLRMQKQQQAQAITHKVGVSVEHGMCSTESNYFVSLNIVLTDFWTETCKSGLIRGFTHLFLLR